MLSSKLNTSYLKKTVNACIGSALQTSKISYNSNSNIVRCKVPDINIPNVFLDEYLWKNLDKKHDKTAVECAETGRRYSYAEVHQKQRRLANFLHKFPNLYPGDTIAVILPNIPEYPIIVLGGIQAGFKITPINWAYTADEIARQLVSSATKLVFTLPELWPQVSRAIKNSNTDISVVTINHQQTDVTPTGAIKFNEVVDQESALHHHIPRNTDDVLLLPYSSGTTGVPKGVELTHRNIISNLYQMAHNSFNILNSSEGSDQERLPAVLPWFHIYGLIIVLFNGLSLGCKIISVPKFGPQIYLRMLKKHQPTCMHLVPPIVLFLSNSPEVLPEYLSQTRTIVTGAAPLGTSDIEKVYRKSNGKVNILQAYGLTETSPLATIQSTQMSNGVKLGGAGFVIPNTECKVIAADGKSKIGLGPNQSGELLIRGPQVMRGYYKNPQATGDVIDSDGWLRTGDIAHYDEDEHFYITDRIKELIKVKGFQVAPAELEELLRAYPDIDDAAVVGVPHEAFGEVPKAFVVLKKDVAFKSEKIHEYIATKAAKYKQLIGGIVPVDSIPRSQAGKILRRQLREL